LYKRKIFDPKRNP